MQLQFGETSHPVFVALAILLLGVGFSLIMTPSVTDAVSTLSRNDAGLASGTFITTQEIGGSVGLALTVLIVRKQTDFHIGFHDGIWVVLVLSLIGVCSALLMDLKKIPMEEKDYTNSQK